MTKTAHDYARDLTLIVDASANALSALNRVLQQQQQSILALASAGSVSAPLLTGNPSASRPAEASAPAEKTETEAASSQPPAPDAPSPEALLAQAEKTAQALMEIAPDFALSHVYHASAHAVSLALLNTASAQQQLNIVAQAVVTRGAANQLSTPTARRPEPAVTEKAEDAAPPSPVRKQAQNSRAR